MKARLLAAFLTAAVAPVSMEAAAQSPAQPGIDAPELAKMGPDSVGFRTLTFVHTAQPDVEHPDPKSGAVVLRDRRLEVDIWYPARATKGAARAVYRGALWGEPPHPPVAFTQPGLAIPNASPRGTRHPLVILSHGYSNAPAVMTWLTENLASKGYVVAAIHHRDPNPYIVAPAIRAAPNYSRPVDISFVTSRLRATLGNQIDPDNVALIGYSQGGYGVLTAGGASLDPDHPNTSLVAGGWMKTIVRGGPAAETIKVPGVKAIVALAPAGGGTQSVWGREGLAGITAPLLLIAGDADPVVGYAQGAKSFYGRAVNSSRYLLTFLQAGHSIGLNPPPTEMRGTVWDLDWFQDPIWRPDRTTAINLHFITAFLGLHLKGDASIAGYLDVPVNASDAGKWDAPANTPWGAFSPGGPGATLWKGFQRRHAAGLRLEHLPAGAAEPTD